MRGAVVAPSIAPALDTGAKAGYCYRWMMNGIGVWRSGGVGVGLKRALACACVWAAACNSSSGNPPSGTAAEGFCSDDDACAERDQVCDTDLSVCVDCTGDGDCDGSEVCERNRCMATDACADTGDCSDGKQCDTDREVCVDCLADDDCESEQLCEDGRCLAQCESEDDCGSSHPVCDAAAGVCVECSDEGDCGENEFCDASNECSARLCTPGSTACGSSGELFVCGDSGEGFEAAGCDESCPVETAGPCDASVSTGGSSSTGGGSGGSGGSGQATSAGGVANSSGGSAGAGTGGSGGSGGGVACSTAAANYCSVLPEFTASEQTLDGVGDEFCDIPPMTGLVANLPFIHADYADTSLPAGYVLRAGWSQEAFHAHVSVTDPSVQTDLSDELWGGDTVQLYIAPSATLGGTFGTDEDGSARHILVSPPDADNPSGRAVFLASSTAYTPVSAENFAARLTAEGYEVEVRLPWASNAEARVSGAQFGFNFSVSVRDSSATYYPELEGWLSYAASSTCDHPWCDDRVWCQPTLM